MMYCTFDEVTSTSRTVRWSIVRWIRAVWGHLAATLPDKAFIPPIADPDSQKASGCSKSCGFGIHCRRLIQQCSISSPYTIHRIPNHLINVAPRRIEHNPNALSPWLPYSRPPCLGDRWMQYTVRQNSHSTKNDIFPLRNIPSPERRPRCLSWQRPGGNGFQHGHGDGAAIVDKFPRCEYSRTMREKGTGTTLEELNRLMWVQRVDGVEELVHGFTALEDSEVVVEPVGWGSAMVRDNIRRYC